MDATIAALQNLRNFFYSAFVELINSLKSLALTIYDILKDAFLFVFDTVLTLAVSIVQAVSIPASWNPAQYITALPSSVVNMLGLIGLGECLTIITAAILIRFTLQLIPFVRLGS